MAKLLTMENRDRREGENQEYCKQKDLNMHSY
jgi:hypothetical protein